ncbi:MAG: Eco57I restriction-modification methylase domain-containing protein, partial [Promethearchaeota archaeon]
KISVNFNNKIFEQGHFCEQLVINGEILSEIVQDLYNYHFLDVKFDILGVIYESYLGYELIHKDGEIRFQPTQDTQKAGGIYYTPTYIVDFILQNTIGPFLSKLFIKFQELLGDNKIIEALEVLSDIQQIKILDPACGSGSFLIFTINMIEEYINRIKVFIKQNFNHYSEKFFEILSTLEKQILKSMIFGIDLDPQAIEITTTNLILQAIKNNENFPEIYENNIKIGNSLIPGDKSILNAEKFTFIIGNPPYIPWNKIPKRKIFESGHYLDLEYDCRPNHEDAQPNIYLFFLVRAINLLKNGKIGFILPQEWRFENYARKFRNYFLEKSKGINIIRFKPQFKVFQNPVKSTGKKIGTNSLILFFDIAEEITADRKLVEYYIDELDEEKIFSYLADPTLLEENSIKIVKKFDELINVPWVFALPQEEKLRKKIKSLPDTISMTDATFFYVKGGFQPPISDIPNYQITSDVLPELTDEEKQYIFPAILDASEMQRYFLNRQDRYWVILNDIDDEMELKKTCPNLYELLLKNLDITRPEWWKFPNIRNFDLIKKFHIKLLSPRTSSRTSFCIDDKKSVFKGTNTMIISLQLNPFYIIGILNSSLADFWYSKFGFEYHGEKTKKYEPQKVREYSLPIRKPPNKQLEAEIITLTKKLIRLKGKQFSDLVDNSELQKLDETIDEIIFSLYDLSPNEINLIKTNR